MAHGIQSPGDLTSSPAAVAGENLTYEQFLADPRYEGIHAEWVNGKVELMTPVSSEHQRILKFLIVLFETFLETNPLGECLFAPFQMKLEPLASGREPDLIFVRGEKAGQVKRGYLDGPADIVVEIISPESRARDRGEKFYEYEKGGVREYWLIDPERKKAEFYRLGSDGTYDAVAVGQDGGFHSAIAEGLWLRPEWFWQSPLPGRRELVKAWEAK